MKTLKRKELAEGQRYYNLSQHTPEDAQFLWEQLRDYVGLPFLMPDGMFWIAPLE